MRLLLLLLTATIPVFATPKLESVSSIPSSTPDSLNDTAGSFGSGAAYDPDSKTLYLTTDRGPGDGAVVFSPRLYAIPIPPYEKNFTSPSNPISPPTPTKIPTASRSSALFPTPLIPNHE